MTDGHEVLRRLGAVYARFSALYFGVYRLGRPLDSLSVYPQLGQPQIGIRDWTVGDEGFTRRFAFHYCSTCDIGLSAHKIVVMGQMLCNHGVMPPLGHDSPLTDTLGRLGHAKPALCEVCGQLVTHPLLCHLRDHPDPIFVCDTLCRHVFETLADGPPLTE